MLTHHLRPRITVCDSEHHNLLVLAMTGSGITAETADDLLNELDRARVVPDNKLPMDVVRMGSRATFRAAGEAPRTVTLAYPGAADIIHGRISVLTPIGTALLGLRVGQSITWMTRDGHKRVLTLLATMMADVAA